MILIFNFNFIVIIIIVITLNLFIYFYYFFLSFLTLPYFLIPRSQPTFIIFFSSFPSSLSHPHNNPTSPNFFLIFFLPISFRIFIFTFFFPFFPTPTTTSSFPQSISLLSPHFHTHLFHPRHTPTLLPLIGNTPVGGATISRQSSPTPMAISLFPFSFFLSLSLSLYLSIYLYFLSTRHPFLLFSF